MFPKFLGKVHPKFATPYLAVITYGLVIFIFSVAGGFQQLAIMASAIILLIYLAVILATVKLRTQKTEGNEKHFKAPGGWITPLLGIGAIIWLLSSLGKWEILSTLIFVAVVSIIYWSQKWIRKKTKPVGLVEVDNTINT